MRTFTLEIVTPERSFPARQVVFLDVPGVVGRLTVLPGHEPFICALTAGPVHLRAVAALAGNDGKEPGVTHETWHIKRGTLSVEANRTTLLVRGAVPPV